MIVTTAVIAIYAGTVYLARRVTRKWHIKHGYLPDIGDFWCAVIPIVNIALILAQIEFDTRKFAVKFFGMKASDE